MGNRAVITTHSTKNVESSSQIGIYLHWNGGRDSVEAFLKYCEIAGHRSPDTDNYGMARLCQVIANMFGGTTSIGIDQCKNLDCDNYDNGVYLIKGWKIVDRQFLRGKEQNEYELEKFLYDLDECQPENSRIGKDKIHSYLEDEKQNKSKELTPELKEEMTRDHVEQDLNYEEQV